MRTSCPSSSFELVLLAYAHADHYYFVGAFTILCRGKLSANVMLAERQPMKNPCRIRIWKPMYAPRNLPAKYRIITKNDAKNERNYSISFGMRHCTELRGGMRI